MPFIFHSLWTEDDENISDGERDGRKGNGVSEIERERVYEWKEEKMCLYFYLMILNFVFSAHFNFRQYGILEDILAKGRINGKVLTSFSERNRSL